MPRTSVEELLDAGVHFGHLKRKWNPAMAPYIFMEKNGVHIIDLNKTLVKLEEAGNALGQIAKSGKKVLFVGTKKQAREIIAEKVSKINQPFVVERWPGGMLTNFVTIRTAVKKMTNIDEMINDGTIDTLNKKERLTMTRTKAKLEKDFGSIADMNRLPAAVFIVDIKKEHIAVAEARRLNIPTFAIVDTNSNPNEVDFPIPANDDATKSISLILDVVCQAIVDGMKDRKADKEDVKEEEAETEVNVTESSEGTIEE
jgi:small subunit ribosomal protein S2